MKITHTHAVLAAVITGALILTSALAQTPDSVPTRAGTLNFERGYPTPETTQKVFDEMDYQRAVQAYLWARDEIESKAQQIVGNEEAWNFINTTIENVTMALHPAGPVPDPGGWYLWDDRLAVYVVDRHFSHAWKAATP